MQHIMKKQVVKCRLKGGVAGVNSVQFWAQLKSIEESRVHGCPAFVPGIG